MVDLGTKFLNLLGEKKSSALFDDILCLMPPSMVLDFPALIGHGPTTFQFGDAVHLSYNNEKQMFIWMAFDLKAFARPVALGLMAGDDAFVVRKKIDKEPITIENYEDGSSSQIFSINDQYCVQCVFDTTGRLSSVYFRIPPEFQKYYGE